MKKSESVRSKYFDSELELNTEHYTNLSEINRPLYRCLRVFAYDPSLSNSLNTASINETTLKVIWEEGVSIGKEKDEGEKVDEKQNKKKRNPLIGPIGEYLEVIDYDPASQSFYAPVNLDDPYLLAQNGLKPTEENPQFHQQMVYAVSMTTIDFFEQALGRVILWAPRSVKDQNGGTIDKKYVQRLRIYPHALREANAYYSPHKKAILFGYFKALGPDHLTNSNFVFTCLSQDIIVHELTHALLDGIHPRYIESTNPDVHAFHEAFADIVALFQHFSNSEVLEDTIRKTRGNLASQNLLGELAQEFGQAIGNRQALRSAIGGIDKNNIWQEHQPNPQQLQESTEAHDRGGILVAAVFRAFLLIYKSRIKDLLRIATQGTGALPIGEIHPDLTKRLAGEAAKVARHLLIACIRGLDYCPPVNITFGDYLRAIITGDYDMAPEDQHNYRVAIVQSFKEWGISPRGVRNFSVESMQYRSHIEDGIQVDNILERDWNLYVDREKAFYSISKNGSRLHKWLTDEKKGGKYLRIFGLTLSKDAPPTVKRKKGVPTIEVHSVRPALRRGPRNNLVTDIVAEVTQKRKGFLDPEQQKRVDAGTVNSANKEKEDFTFRRGCTLIIDMITLKIRYIIKTAGDVTDDSELDKVRQYHLSELQSSANAFRPNSLIHDQSEEYFAAIHRH